VLALLAIWVLDFVLTAVRSRLFCHFKKLKNNIFYIFILFYFINIKNNFKKLKNII